MNSIQYRAGYKYQLAQPYETHISIYLESPVKTEFIRLGPVGHLFISKGYAWDGPSGPAIDTKSAMRGSLIHDALYQLIRLRLLSENMREAADKIYRDALIKDANSIITGNYPFWMQGMAISLSRARAWLDFEGLRALGWTATDPESERPILIAP